MSCFNLFLIPSGPNRRNKLSLSKDLHSPDNADVEIEKLDYFRRGLYFQTDWWKTLFLLILNRRDFSIPLICSACSLLHFGQFNLRWSAVYTSFYLPGLYLTSRQSMEISIRHAENGNARESANNGLLFSSRKSCCLDCFVEDLTSLHIKTEMKSCFLCRLVLAGWWWWCARSAVTSSTRLIIYLQLVAAATTCTSAFDDALNLSSRLGQDKLQERLFHFITEWQTGILTEAAEL